MTMVSLSVDEVEERYQEYLDQLGLLIAYAQTVSVSIQGKGPVDEQKFYASYIFSKIVAHAITLVRSVPQGAPISGNNEGELWDISSACCLTRAILEANDALAYMADKSVGAEQIELRIRVWELHNIERRISMLASINSTLPEVDELRRSEVKLRSDIIGSPSATALHKRNIGKINKGDTPDFLVPIRMRCELAGINYSYYVGAKMFLSAYVHTHPFALHQLASFRAGDANSLRLIIVSLGYALGFLSVSLKLMRRIFGNDVPDANEPTVGTISIWSGVAENGVQA